MSIEKVVDKYLASARGQQVIKVMAPAFVEVVRQQTQAEFGERCEDFEAGCAVCEAWAHFDRFTSDRGSGAHCQGAFGRGAT